MSEAQQRDIDETATIRVRVYRNGELIHEELCESEEQARLVALGWEEFEAVRCDVDQLSPGPTTEPADDESTGDLWEDYPGIADARTERFC
jgi:hypothetical protein